MFKNKIRFYISCIMMIMCCFLMACSGKKPETGKENTVIPSYIPEKTVTLKVFSELTGYEGMQEGWFADIMEEKFNVKLDIIMADSDETENNYYGDYDIIISGGSLAGDFSEAVEEGYILNLSNSGMEKYMPYISEYLEHSCIRYPEESGESVYVIKTSASLPGDYEHSYITWKMRFDYYEELGKPVISDINDWVNVLEQMHEQHPTNEEGKTVYGTTVTYVNEPGDGKLFEVDLLVRGYYGYESNGMGFYDWENSRYYGVLAMEDDGSYGPYLQMLKVYNDLYQKGLLYMDSDPDVTTEEEAHIGDSQILATLLDGWSAMANEYMYPVIPEEAHMLTYELGGGWSNRCISIDSQTEYPELCMAIVDYFYSPEGMLTMTYGPEGECWYYDEDGYTCLTELGLACWYDRDTVMPDKETYGSGQPMFNITPYYYLATNTDNGERFEFTYWESFVEEPDNDTEAAWREWTGTDSVAKYMNSFEKYYVAPGTEYLYSEDTEISLQYDNVSVIITDKSWEAIQASTDEEFDLIVQEMITSASEAGYEDCVEYSENFIKEQL